MVDPEFELVEATGRGDREAFERLVRRYQDPLCNFITRHIGDRSTAEDITQEVFLRVYQAAPRFDPKGRVSSWIFKIAYNLSMNELKRRKHLQGLLRDAADIVDRNGRSTSPGSLPGRELEEELMAAMGDLSEDQRAALLLRVHEDFSYRDIAKVLGTTVQSVESLLFRARQRMRMSLGRNKQIG
jgi:RNA polymerase sigma-70 factor, ECF subfamily